MRSMPGPTPRALADRLVDIAQVIETIDDGTYATARQDGVSGSVGAHVRHTLDHCAALLEPPTDRAIDYDSRRRGTDIERNRSAAITELRRLASQAHLINAEAEARLLTLSAVVARDGTRSTSQSTLGRELVFVLSHTVHHQAIIALLLAAEGRRTPERFSLAPSTPAPAKPAECQPCARSA
jgi:uncharacterized damage-inducible protein DinB